MACSSFSVYEVAHGVLWVGHPWGSTTSPEGKKPKSGARVTGLIWMSQFNLPPTSPRVLVLKLQLWGVVSCSLGKLLCFPLLTLVRNTALDCRQQDIFKTLGHPKKPHTWSSDSAPSILCDMARNPGAYFADHTSPHWFPLKHCCPVCTGRMALTDQRQPFCLAYL